MARYVGSAPSKMSEWLLWFLGLHCGSVRWFRDRGQKPIDRPKNRTIQNATPKSGNTYRVGGFEDSVVRFFAWAAD